MEPSNSIRTTPSAPVRERGGDRMQEVVNGGLVGGISASLLITAFSALALRLSRRALFNTAKYGLEGVRFYNDFFAVLPRIATLMFISGFGGGAVTSGTREELGGFTQFGLSSLLVGPLVSFLTGKVFWRLGAQGSIIGVIGGGLGFGAAALFT